MRQRIFLTTLIVAATYLDHACPKNKFWAEYVLMFHINDIKMMEMQLLFLLNYGLRFNKSKVCATFSPFLQTTPGAAATAPLVSATRLKAVSHVAQDKTRRKG